MKRTQTHEIAVNDHNAYAHISMVRCIEKKSHREEKNWVNFHLINYSYIIHLSYIFCAFTLECKYILRALKTRPKNTATSTPAKQTHIYMCAFCEFWKQIIAWALCSLWLNVYTNFVGFVFSRSLLSIEGRFCGQFWYRMLTNHIAS